MQGRARVAWLGALLGCACFGDAGSGATEPASSSGETGAEDLTGGTDQKRCGDGVVDPDEACDLGAANSDAGPCTASCALAVCGDGLRARFEGCDDGDLEDGDGCSALCRGEACGDAIVQPATEGCDDGNAVDGDGCTGLCRPPVCGDGAIQAPEEQCDAGAANSDNGACTLGCRLAACGDGLIGPGELCDDGNAIDFDGCPNTCVGQGCGNGIVEPGEVCDDGNQHNTDGCLNHCKPAVCGDGFVQAGVETCDDGGVVGGDGCSATCASEGGPPSSCGDATLQPPEECDDGGAVAGDGCSALCMKELRRVFVTAAAYDGALGGLAGADAKCQAAATAAGLPGRYLAWLSDGTSSPSSRMVHAQAPYVRVDGVAVAQGWDDLSDGTLAAAIVLTELGGVPALGPSPCGDPQAALVWTATSPAGLAADPASTCADWSSGLVGAAQVGNAARVDVAWTAHCNAVCPQAAALYCVEA